MYFIFVNGNLSSFDLFKTIIYHLVVPKNLMNIKCSRSPWQFLVFTSRIDFFEFNPVFYGYCCCIFFGIERRHSRFGFIFQLSNLVIFDNYEHGSEDGVYPKFDNGFFVLVLDIYILEKSHACSLIFDMTGHFY